MILSVLAAILLLTAPAAPGAHGEDLGTPQSSTSSAPAPPSGDGGRGANAPPAEAAASPAPKDPAGAPPAAAAASPAPKDPAGAPPAAAATSPASKDSADAPAPLSAAGLKQIRKEIAARKGAPLLVNFWASWCEPCVDELPDLAKIESRFAAKRVRVLGVACDLMLEDDSATLRRKVAEVLSSSGVHYPNYLYEGRDSPLIEAYDLPGPIPHTILYGADGKVIRRWTGRLRMTDLDSVLNAL